MPSRELDPREGPPVEPDPRDTEARDVFAAGGDPFAAMGSRDPATDGFRDAGRGLGSGLEALSGWLGADLANNGGRFDTPGGGSQPGGASLAGAGDPGAFLGGGRNPSSDMGSGPTGMAQTIDSLGGMAPGSRDQWYQDGNPQMSTPTPQGPPPGLDPWANAHGEYAGAPTYFGALPADASAIDASNKASANRGYGFMGGGAGPGFAPPPAAPPGAAGGGSGPPDGLRQMFAPDQPGPGTNDFAGWLGGSGARPGGGPPPGVPLPGGVGGGYGGVGALADDSSLPGHPVAGRPGVRSSNGYADQGILGNPPLTINGQTTGIVPGSQGQLPAHMNTPIGRMVAQEEPNLSLLRTEGAPENMPAGSIQSILRMLQMATAPRQAR